MMNHSVPQRPQNKPLYLSNDVFWEFQAYNYKEEEMLVQHARRRERMSLDDMLIRQERPMKLEEIKQKKQKQQSTSSSGRFVNLLNTFFSQFSSKKKRPINSSWKDGEGSDFYPGNRKGTRSRRRNSMSQFLSSRVADSRFLFDDHKRVMTRPRGQDEHGRSIVSREGMDFEDDAKFEFPKQRPGNPGLGRDGRKTWQDVKHCHEEKLSGEEDEDYDSDSSSDLFELKNF